MHQRTTTFGVEGERMPSARTTFLWWLAAADLRVIKHAATDSGKLAITGYTVLCTWLFATLSWTYFFTTVTNLYAAITLGLFMGFVILCIDRALIKSINSRNRYKVFPLLFRTALAVTIGMFMAQPALLYLFDKEIQTQVLQDNEARKKQKLMALTQLYEPQVQLLQKEKQQLQQQLQANRGEVAAARDAFLAETDGTGGSKRRGLATIAKTKQAAYEQLNQQYILQEIQQRPALQRIDSTLAAIQNNIQQEQAAFNNSLQSGFLTRIEALQNLLQNHTALQYRYYLLIALILLIELMPVLVKILLPATTYEAIMEQSNSSEQQRALLDIEQNTALQIQTMESMHAYNKATTTTFFEQAGTASNAYITQELSNNSATTEDTMQNRWEKVRKQTQVKH